MSDIEDLLSDEEFMTDDESVEEISTDDEILSIEDSESDADELYDSEVSENEEDDDSEVSENEEDDDLLYESEGEQEEKPLVKKKKVEITRPQRKEENVEKPKSLVKRAKISESIEEETPKIQFKPKFQGRKKIETKSDIKEKREKIISAPSSNIKYDNKISISKEDGQTVISDRRLKTKSEKMDKMERYEVGIDNMPYAFRELYKILEKSMTYPLIKTSAFIYDCSYPDM